MSGKGRDFYLKLIYLLLFFYQRCFCRKKYVSYRNIFFYAQTGGVICKNLSIMKQKALWAIVGLFVSSISIFAQNQGLVGEYYDGSNFEKKVLTRTDKKIDFYWDNEAPARGINPQEFSIRWTGQIKAPKSGKYMFRAKVDDGIRVKVGGQSVINAWGLNDEGKFMGYINLQEGQLYNLEVEYFNGLFEGEIQLFWQLPGDEPVFGGALGYNDKIIDSKYFYAPEATPPPPPPTPKATKPPTKKPAPTPAPKPEKKPAPQTPPPPPAPVVIKDSIEKFTPKNILFERSKTAMLEGSKLELDRLAGFLNRHPKLKLTIEGHTDNLGDPAKNLELSQKRTERVAAYLTSKGVEASRITAIGYGDTRPLIKSEKGSPKNRRVVFLIE
jgi:outer membrane protein OmpA-like peptidoglycan-associated protein